MGSTMLAGSTPPTTTAWSPERPLPLRRPTAEGQGIAGLHPVCTRAEPRSGAVSGDPAGPVTPCRNGAAAARPGASTGWSLDPVSHPWAETRQSIKEHDAPSTVNASLEPDHGEEAARRRESNSMSTHTSTKTTDGFTAAERAAMKQRAEELRAEGRSGAKKAEGLQALLDSIAKMDPADRAIAERVHVTVTANAPDLAPKTWYGMPAYTNADGKVVLSFKNAGKFGQRYSTLEFQDSAHLDDGDVWPVGFALVTWTPEVEDKVGALVRAAVS